MRRMGMLPAICLLFAAASGEAAPEGATPSNQRQAAEQALADVCAKVACRKSVRTLSLRTRNGGQGEINTDPFPYLDPNGNVIIYPGETITVALPKDGNGKPRLLKVTDPSGTTDFGNMEPSEASLEFQFRQADGKPDMELVATNKLPLMLKYDAIMVAVTDKGLNRVPTSICPLLPPQGTAPSFGGFETWPFPIVDLVITHIRVLPKGSPMTCS